MGTDINKLYKDKNEFEAFLMNQLNSRLKGNFFYKQQLQEDKKIISYPVNENEITFQIFNIEITFASHNQRWEIEYDSNMSVSERGLLGYVLLSVSGKHSLECMLAEYKEAFFQIVKIIKENSEYNVLDLKTATHIDRCEMLLLLKNRLEKLTNYEIHWFGLENNVSKLQIVDLDIQLILPERDFVDFSIDADSIVLPTPRWVSHEELIERYFSEFELLNALKRFELQNSFKKRDQFELGDLLHIYTIYRAYNVFVNAKSDIDYLKAFRAANKNVNIYEIIYSSEIGLFPCDTLKSSSESTNPGYSFAIKTESGIYYLKDDRRTIGFQTLKETYRYL